MNNKKKNISTELPDNSNPFVVPEHYFELLSERLMERIDSEADNVKPKQSKFQILRPILAIAASITLVFFIIYLPVKRLGFSIAEKNETTAPTYLDYIEFYNINDGAIYEAFNQDTVNQNNQVVIETYLMASVSDLELMELNH